MRKLKNILLVDDDEVTNFINQEILDSMQISGHIDVCTNGREAIDFFDDATKGNHEKIMPELVFLDINMPVMDGFEFLKEYKIRNYPESQTVIITMLTTSLRAEDMSEAQKFDDVVSGYIEKPLTKTVVENVIKQYFEKKA